MLRVLLLAIGLVLAVTGVAELITIVSKGRTWMDWLWALLALVSGVALLVGAWRSDAEGVARWFGVRKS